MRKLGCVILAGGALLMVVPLASAAGVVNGTVIKAASETVNPVEEVRHRRWHRRHHQHRRHHHHRRHQHRR